MSNRYVGQHERKRFVRTPTTNNTERPMPLVDWQQQRQFYRNQVIRHNCNNADYERFLLLSKKKMREYVDDVFLPNDSAFRGMPKANETRQNILPN